MYVGSMTDSRSHSQCPPGRRRQRGVSLIEILIVLVILVVGILTIIRLYPSGFFSLESVGNSALADAMGAAAVQSQVQNSAGLPNSIFPGTLLVQQYTDADYDPDDPNTLDNARVISNETITVPSQSSGGALKSVYVVSYGPINMVGTLSNSLIINGSYWQNVSGNAADALGATPSYPQDELANSQNPGQQRFLVDYAQGKIAMPYAQTFSQAFTLLVVAHDSVSNTDKLYTVEFTVPASGSSASVTSPQDPTNPNAYLPNSAAYYNGNWFDPVNGNGTFNYNTSSLPGMPATPWKSVMLYRTFQSVASATAFTDDPYQFTLVAPNITGANANPGAIQFNPKAAGGVGIKPLKAQISYQTYSWGILHEDRDIPALTGSDTSVVRLTLKNLLSAGAARPDNTLFTGLAGGSLDMVVLDLDSGDWQTVTPKLFNEDTNGPDTSGTKVNVSYATGRLTFPAGVFGDNLAHRVRIFYAGDADWTVAVQKAPALYARQPDVNGGDPMLAPGQFAFDLADKTLLFPHSDFGKTIEIDGLVSYDANGVATAYPNITTVIGKGTDQLDWIGAAKYWRLSDLAGVLPATLYAKGPNNADITITAVRGLSARAVVAWKERNLWKVHSVDTVLTRPQ